MTTPPNPGISGNDGMMQTDKDQLFCFLDVLGFSSIINKVGLDYLHKKYKELLKAAKDQQVDGVFLSERSGHPYFGYQKIQSTYFSDTIVFWCRYDIHHLEVLANCLKEVICISIEIGLPLRGAISVGEAIVESDENIFLGEPIVKAVHAEKVQTWIGITLSNSFSKEPYCCGFKADCFLPYKKHLKPGGLSKVTPLVLDFPRQWRKTRSHSLIRAVKKLDRDPKFSDYYNNTLEFIKFSERSDRWWEKYPKEKQ